MRRRQLPRIRPEALEEPDFAEIGPKPARHDGQRGPRSGQGSVFGCLSRQRTAPALPLAALVDVFGVDRGPWMRSRRRPRRPRAGHNHPVAMATLDAAFLLAGSSAPRPHGPRLPTFSVLRYLGRHVSATKMPDFIPPVHGIFLLATLYMLRTDRAGLLALQVFAPFVGHQSRTPSGLPCPRPKHDLALRL